MLQDSPMAEHRLQRSTGCHAASDEEAVSQWQASQLRYAYMQHASMSNLMLVL